MRNLIVRYSKEGDLLLDPMIGGGKTAIECKLLNRNLVAYDINPDAIELTRKALEFEMEDDGLLRTSQGQIGKEGQVKLKLNDSRNLGGIKDEQVDFVLNHPPYVDIIKYSSGIEGDLSLIHDLEKFCDEYEKGH